MNCCRIFLITITVMFVGISYYLYVPPYEGFEEKITLGLLMSLSKLNGLFVSIASKLRLGTNVELSRLAFSARASLLKKRDDFALDVKDTVFGKVPVRVYRPTGQAGQAGQGKVALPGLVFMHGGGWTFGDVDYYDSMTSKIAVELNAVVVSVEYRLSPEFKFPVPFHDCEVATVHFIQNAVKYGVDPSRIAVAGDSAGGNLAAAVALKLRNRSPAVKLQLLIYPLLQAIDFATPSYQLNSEDSFLSRASTLRLVLYYAQGHKSNNYEYLLRNEHTTPAIKKTMARSFINHDVISEEYKQPPYRTPNMDIGNETVWKEIQGTFLNPYFAPLLAKNLTGVARAVIVTCGKDVLRDDGMMYSHRLQTAGSDVTLLHYDYAFHGFLSLHNFLTESKIALAEIMEEVKEKL